MSKKHPFVVNVAAIRGTPGSRQEVEVRGHLDELTVSVSAVPGDADVRFVGTVEAIEGPAMVATGSVVAPWRGECRRCLGQATGAVEQRVREVFEYEPTEGETYLLNGDTIDIEMMVREVVMLELPEAPLCKADCAGLCPKCGVNRNETSCGCSTEVLDPRWAALDALKQED